MMYTVARGDCLSSIAKAHGFQNWRTIYDDPNNAALRAERPNPNVILPGDQVYIPDLKKKDESCTTGKTHTFRLKTTKTWLRLEPLDAQWNTCPGKKFRLEIDDKLHTENTVPSDGVIHVAIPAGAMTGTLTVWMDDAHRDGLVWALQLGDLDPVEHMTGIQGRLNNLGFDCGDVDGDCGPLTRSAVEAFQEKHNLVVDGIPGPVTQAKLKEVHGC